MKSINLNLLNEAITGSELRQDEVAQLFGVSRQTLYSWRAGRPAANNFIVDRAEKICQSLVSAIKAGTLPLSKETASSSRMMKIKSAMLGR